MSDQSPTIGELKRENEELRREIEDLKARMETVEGEMGLLDGEAEKYEDNTPSLIEELVDELGRKQEQEFRQRSTGGPR